MKTEEAIKQLKSIRRCYIYITPNPNLEAIDMAIEALSAVEGIRKLQDILLMKIDSFEGTRNIVEKGMLEAWKDVAEYIDGMLEGGDDE